ncbi:glycosyltransferase family 4 protein [Bacillus sp. SM2101]|uniref:glycosyltransferase family 4 protein n=1 Tax=Bacillus sp. SM2101 TaxID=2805366 RepID=UPI001BDEBE98|nr:glycosyltransferase family 4 protein [Bacillus sp. SM2101]
MYEELKLKEFNKRLAQQHMSEKQVLCQKDKTEDSFHIVYVMSSVAVSGGVKIIFEHVNRLTRLGIKVTIVTHFEKPHWYPIDATYIQVPFTIELAKGIPNCDVIVATYWDHIQSCIDTGIAPVVYFEQGDFHLFDYESMNDALKVFIKRQYELPTFIYTVSKNAAKLINKNYGREASVIHNAIDESIFYDGSSSFKSEKRYMLMVGAESASFKGIREIIEAYQVIQQEYDISLFWITPEEPSNDMRNKVTKAFVQPSQSTIADLYRGARLYVSASHYESFSLPPLEAMSCGCPVVTTENDGVLEYAIDRENVLVCRIRDPIDLTSKIKKVLDDDELVDLLITNGLSTAKQFKWHVTIDEIYDYYKKVASFKVKRQHTEEDWNIGISEDAFINPSDYIKFLKLLNITKASVIKVPVVYEIDSSLKIARWEVVAYHKNIQNHVEDICYSPVQSDNNEIFVNHKGYRPFIEREFEEALKDFTSLYDETKDPQLQAIYFRWMLLCLYRLQRRFEAKKKLRNHSFQDTHFSEIYFLKKLLENKNSNETATWNMSVLGDAVSYPEYIYQINKLSV